ncbi:MAG: hypothetical protein AAGA12_03410 [Pseudomonadota bacterium]
MSQYLIEDTEVYDPRLPMDGPSPIGSSDKEPRKPKLAFAMRSMRVFAEVIVDPKLVLSWLLATLGAPVAMIGLLVPLRVLGEVVPKRVAQRHVDQIARMPWAPMVVCALAAAAIVLTALTQRGILAGWIIGAAIFCVGVSRGLAHLSDAASDHGFARSDPNQNAWHRSANSAPLGLFAFALLLMLGWTDMFTFIALGLGVAAIIWAMLAVLIARFAVKAAPQACSLPTTDAPVSPEIKRWAVARGLLSSTILTPPFLILFGSGAQVFGHIWALMFAHVFAAVIAPRIWSRLSLSAGRILQVSSALVFAAMIGALALGQFAMAGFAPALSAVMFLISFAFHGVQASGDSVLSRLESWETRIAAKKLANTSLVAAMILGGGVALVATYIGISAVLGIFAVAALVSIWLSRGLSTQS